MSATAAPRRERLGRAGLHWSARQWASTPGRLRLWGLVLVLAVVLFGVVATGATNSRRHAAVAVAHDTEPLLVEADGLYAALSDADATATGTFLTGGLEPAARRGRYLADLHVASNRLTTLSREVGGSGAARAAVSVIGAQLPVYTGLVESARAANRQGFPVGAAYLRQGSTLMRTRILPAGRGLYVEEANRLGADYRVGTGNGRLIAVVVVAGVLLIALLVGQLYLARVTHRVLNVGMLAATIVLLGAGAWALVGLVGEQDALVRAQRNGSDSVQVLSAIRILTLRAQTDESLALIARGGGDQQLKDFDTVMGVLDPRRTDSGLISEAARLARRTGEGTALAALTRDLADYRSAHRGVATLETQGRFGEAVALSIGRRSHEAALGARLGTATGRAIDAAQARFAAAAGDAREALGHLGIALPALALVIVALALAGLRPRLLEYR